MLGAGSVWRANVRHRFRVLSASLLPALAVVLVTSTVVATAAGKPQSVGIADVDNMVKALRIPAGINERQANDNC